MGNTGHVLVVTSEGTKSCGIFDRTFAVYSSLVSFFIPLVVMLVADARSIQTLRRNFRFRSDPTSPTIAYYRLVTDGASLTRKKNDQKKT